MGKIKLDDIDHQILDILIDNTRVPFTDISKRFSYLLEQSMFVLKNGRCWNNKRLVFERRL